MRKIARESQLAKYHLKKWTHFERNFARLEKWEKRQAKNFFTCLEKINEEDLAILAQRYYFSTKKTAYRKEYGQCTSVNPMSYEVVADQLNMLPKEVQTRLRQIEYYLGSDLKEMIEFSLEQKRKTDNAKKLKRYRIIRK